MGESIIPSDWTGEYCCYSIQWPNSPQWLAVLRGVLVSASRGRHWAENTGNIIEAQGVIKFTLDHNLLLEECIVSCNDSGLSEIAAALRILANAQCCGSGPLGGVGSGGATGEMPPLLDIEQGDPLTDPPPDGYEDWEDFFNQKCGVANNILGQFENSLEAISIISLGTLGLDALAFTLSIVITLTVPPATIIAIAAFLIGAYGAMIVSTLLSIISANKEDLVCELYNGTSPQSSLDNFHTLLGALIDSDVSDPVQNAAAKQVAHYFINNSVVNPLYEKDLTKVWGTQDCSACGEELCGQCMDRISGAGAVVSQYDVGGTWNEVNSESYSGYYVLAYKVNTGLVNAQFRNIVGFTSGGAYSFVLSNNTYGDVLTTPDFATFASACETFIGSDADAEVRNWAIESTTPFTVEMLTSVG